MEHQSIWKEDIKKSSFQIPGHLKTDLLIIGGGITGISTAFFLKDSKKKITLIDRGNIGYGVSLKTTAKVTYLQGIIYQTLEKNFNKKVAKKYFESQKEAISLIEENVKKYSIACDFEQVKSIIFTMEEQGISKIEKEEALLKEWGVSVDRVKHPNIKAGIGVSDTYVFHPLKYLQGLIRSFSSNISIYEGVLAERITCSDSSYLIHTNCGVIEAEKIVVANHYPFFLVPFFMPLKTYIQREYVSAGKIQESLKFSAVSIDSVLHSIRFYHDYVIYGSHKQRITEKTNYQLGYVENRSHFQKYFGKKPEFSWMNQDVMSNDSLPFIGKVKKNLYIATAYQAWGMTNGVIAGKVLSDLIQTGKSSYQALFQPYRMNLGLFVNSFSGAFRYLGVYTQSLWKKNIPTYIKIEGVLHGVYIDHYGKRHVVKLLCPHMKCNLVFNKEEETWDCPCHGSRFDLDGKILEGPSVYPISRD